jgi:hypothetical protein
MSALASGPRFNAESTLRSQIRLPLDGAALARFGVRDVLLDTTIGTPEQVVPGWQGPLAREGQLEVWRNPAFVAEGRLATRWTSATALDVRVAVILGETAVPLVEQDCDCPSVEHGGPGSPERPVELVRPGDGQRIDVATVGHAAEPALLVTDEQWDPGWRVRVDGRPAPPRVVDRFFLGVELPPGQHRVTFDYAVVHGRLGLALSGLGLLAVLVLLVAAGRAGRAARRARGAPRSR